MIKNNQVIEKLVNCNPHHDRLNISLRTHLLSDIYYKSNQQNKLQKGKL